MSDDQSTEGEWLYPAEVARLLAVSTKTVNRWAHEGRLASFKTLGGHHRFPHAYVERLRRELGFDRGE